MTDLFWPGDERAGELMSESALLHAMVSVESAWLAALREYGIAEVDEHAADLDGLLESGDAATIASEAEPGGNPVIPLLSLLRERLPQAAARWLHRGLTSQDVLDTGLLLCLRAVLERLGTELAAQRESLVRLVEEHRGTLLTGRTLTQPAVPITFGLKAAGWLTCVLDAEEEHAGIVLPGQFGGAAGTLAAPAELARLSGSPEPASTARGLAEHAATRLGLRPSTPWHTSRAPITRLGDALVRCTDAFGRIAGDVLTMVRPELGELAEPSAEGRGGSSAMPHKQNPVLSVLIRRAALAAPNNAAQLHLAAAEARDERPDGAWHLEWASLRTLARHTVTAAAQTTELLRGLRVDPERMRANALAAETLAEAAAVAGLFDAPGIEEPGDYLGATEPIIAETLRRADQHRRR